MQGGLGYGNSGLSAPWAGSLYIAAVGSTPITMIAGAAERMRITTSGDVGIGTTSPAAALDVNGAIDIAGRNGLSVPANDASGGSLSVGPGALAALQAVTSGWSTAVGSNALGAATTGTANTALGYGAGASITTGSSNIAIGALAASTTLSSGSNDILIGNAVDTPAPDTSNYLNIGNLIYGNLGGANLGIGAVPSNYAILDLSSQDNALALPGNSSGTGGRPASGHEINGMLRYNSDTPGLEAFVDGSWTTLLADTTTGTSSNLYLGSATTANPQIYGEPTSGFYTATANTIDVEANGSKIAEWTTGGETIANGNLAVTNGSATAQSFTPTSSTVPLNGLYYPAPNSLALSTSGAAALTITATGSVGIGTTAPAYALHVMGSSAAQDVGGSTGTLAVGPANVSFSPGIIMGYLNGNYNWLQGYGALPLYINPVGNNTIFNANGGSVGIGTTTPAGALDVVTTSASYAGHFSNTATTHTYGISSTIADLTTGAAVFAAATGSANTGYAAFFTNTSTGVANYGLYASTSSATGWAGYFQGNVNIAGNAAISGTTTVGNIIVTGTCTGCGSGAFISLSSLTSATTTNTIDNTNFAQTWKWGTLSTETALTLSTSSLTSGTLLNLSDTSVSANGGTVLTIANSETGTAYGVSSSLTGAGNAGYAGYFNNSGLGYALAASGTSYFAGSVGIGTATPNTTLNIYDPSQSTTLTNFTQNIAKAGLNITTSFVDTAYTPGIFWSTDNSNPLRPKAGIWTYNDNANGSSIYFGTSNSYATGINRMVVIDPFGGVGIGTTSPATALDIVTTTGANLAVINIRNNAANAASAVEWLDNNGTVQGAIGYGNSGLLNAFGGNTYLASPNAPMVFITGGANNERMRITTTGSVGIGTNSPANELDVNGAVAIGGAYAGLATAPSGGLIVGGNVGIGTPTPGTTLEVAGALRLSTSTTDNFVSPLGSSIPTKINVPLFDPGAYGQMLAMGLPSSAQTTERVITMVDARTVPHQPTIEVLSPNESQFFGLTFNGSNTAAYVASSVDLGFIANSYTPLYLSSSTGNVGIGTTSPAGQLDVVTTSASYAGYFSNTATTHTYGVYSTIADLTTGAALFGAATGNANTGYAGYFANTSTGVLNYGLYASTSSASGYAGYFQGAVNVAGNLSATNAAISGTTTVNNITVTGGCVGCLAPGSNALSALTSATATNTIDNADYGQIWSWNSLSSGTAFTISSNSMTTGSLLSLQDTAAAATSTGKVLSISDATTGAGFGVYSAMTATDNTGYAGYFGSSSTGTGYALYATITGSGNTGYAGYFNNSGAGYAVAASGTSYFNGSVGIGTATPATSLDLVGDLTFRTNSSSPGLAIRDRPDQPGMQLDFEGNDGTAYTVFNVTTKNATTSSGKTGAIAIWDTSVGNVGNATQFQMQRSPTYGGILFTEKFGTNAEGSQPVSIQAEWNQTSTPTQLVLATNGNVGIGTASPSGMLSINSTASGSGYGVYAISATTTNGTDIYALNDGTGNTGYAGYFTNTSTGVLNFGLYASTSSASGWAGYFDGAVNVAGNLTVSSCTGCSGAGSNALSAITSATTTNSIDSTNMAQIWKWGTLSTQTALTLSTEMDPDRETAGAVF